MPIRSVETHPAGLADWPGERCFNYVRPNNEGGFSNFPLVTNKYNGWILQWVAFCVELMLFSHLSFNAASGCRGDASPDSMDGEDPFCAWREPPGRRAGGGLPIRQNPLSRGDQGADPHPRWPRLPLAGLLLRLHPPPDDRRQPTGLPHRRLCQGGRHHQWRILAHCSRQSVSVAARVFSHWS